MTNCDDPNLMQWDHVADEPYLSLPSFPDLRLTPWRSTDVDAAIELFNDPVVAKYASVRPYPYRKADFEYFSNFIASNSKKAVDALRPILAFSSDGPKTGIQAKWSKDQVPFFPLIALRHVPTDRLIGDIQLFQPGTNYWDRDVPCEAVQIQRVKEADQTWAVGYNMHPLWRGKGVAGEMLDVVVEGWLKFIGIGTLIAFIESGNPASCALVRSRGFREVVREMQAWPEDKGGGEREIIEWSIKVKEYRSRLALAIDQ